MYQFGRWKKDEASGERATICLCFPAFRDNVIGVVAPISKYDVILGKPWLYKHNPKIDFRKNDVEFNDADQDTRAAEPATKGLTPTGEVKEELIAEQARVDEESDLFFMTAKAARKAIRKGADWYMLRVEDLCSELGGARQKFIC